MYIQQLAVSTYLTALSHIATECNSLIDLQYINLGTFILTSEKNDFLAITAEFRYCKVTTSDELGEGIKQKHKNARCCVIVQS
jgi:hypothetical protein